jgi:ATP-dependent DNA ligase
MTGVRLIKHEVVPKCGDMGLEELVSKRADRPYSGGRSKDWIKIKNRKHPAIERGELFGK